MNDNKILLNSCELNEFDKDMKTVDSSNVNRFNADADSGLAQLVLTLVELIRKLVEKQAIRRVEGGSLSDEEIERLGESLMKLDIKMEELKIIFNLTEKDLNINLGPLGDLM